MPTHKQSLKKLLAVGLKKIQKCTVPRTYQPPTPSFLPIYLFFIIFLVGSGSKTTFRGLLSEQTASVETSETAAFSLPLFPCREEQRKVPNLRRASMDVDFWAPRVRSSRHVSATQVASLNSETHVILDDSEGDDDMRVRFPCPFCYVDIEVPVLCTHLQDEHCFDMKNAVCPVCAANLGKDMIGHFTLQHSHLLKRRKPQRTGFWSGSSRVLGKELRDLNSYSHVGSTNSGGNVPSAAAPDPLLSPFLCGLPPPYFNDSRDAISTVDGVESIISDAKCMESSVSDGAGEQYDEETRQRAEFVQQLLLSTVF